jgi:hypothetical protein
MTMLFDGEEVKIGDSMYDVAYGAGTVVELMPRQSQFRVKFGERTFTYRLNGQSVFPRKTLFWREPIGKYYPRKNDTKWATFLNLCDAIAHALDIAGD